MANNILYIDENSTIPLMGIDFIGVIDRGTNVIEVKPLTLCNLRCKYCFVSAGDYTTNFVVNHSYLAAQIKEIIALKGNYHIEVHFSPYGEIFMYSELFDLLSELERIDGIDTISIQTNGLLLNDRIIEGLKLKKHCRINLSLNTLDADKARYLSACSNYDLERLQKNIYKLLNADIEVLIAPVWFPGENDEDIEDIIELILNLRKKGYPKEQLRIGIQKYLIYKTGRKLKKIRPKSWGYFYKQLSQLEKKYNIKLKLGPIDFNIHKRKSFSTPYLKKGMVLEATILSQGRWKWECIGKINDRLGIKILLKRPFQFTPQLLGKKIEVKVIKANYRDNIITASYPLF
ncbi:MAG: radical SAM protein [Promethearchaeota archaeon]|nr:MAG: radical SAM protein [Candidatus Lokiarchaeota archaeon]